jgi:N-formylglutamate amidohydrolase
MKQNKFPGTIAVLIFLLSGLVASSQPYIPGVSYFGRNNYIEYIAGNIPLIISVPHGGDLSPSEIPNRVCGDETVTDSYTTELVRELSAAINKITGCYPHVIICNLKRTKLDANRELETAACGNQWAEIAWNEYHQYLDAASLKVTQESGKGLCIDLHGHGHAIQRLELGYLLTAAQLRYSDFTLNTATYKSYSSILNLINTNILGLSHSELLRGMSSLGTLFAIKNVPSVPSIDDPFPLSGESYFSGGYNTDRHGSKTQGTIDGIQVECNQDIRFTSTARKDFASKAAIVFLNYLTIHYFPELANTYCNTVGVSELLISQSKLYPNPFNNLLNVQINIPSDLQIYNFQGSLVYSKSIITEEIIDLSQLKGGIYLVTLSIKGKIFHTEKIIKKI